MKVTKTSPFSGEQHTLEVNVTEEVMEEFRKGKITAFRAFNHLSDSEMRFLTDGITPEEWNEMFEENHHMQYDRESSRAFWCGYLAVLILAGYLCYKYLWG